MAWSPPPLDGTAIFLCSVLAGSKISEVETGDPLRKKYVIAHPEHPPKTIVIGPEGVTVTEITCAPGMAIDVGVGVSGRP